jgi:type VI secretion system ImpM family protein
MAESSERPGLFRRLLQGGADEEKVRTARFPLQAYGKLPIYKDFISIGLTDAGAREFRQWLDRGFSYRWAENEEYRDTEIPAHGFLLRLPESRSCVAGALWGSSDEGGLRKFPFAVFLSFPISAPAAEPLAAVHYLAALERRCEEIRDGYAAGASLSGFYKAYRGAEFECALKTREQAGRELKSAIGDFAVSDFAESLFGSRAAARWPAFLAELEDAANRSNGPGAIRLPLGGVLPRSREISIWLRWLDRLDAKRRRPFTGVLYSSGRGPGRAVLFFRDLAPEDFLLLHPAHRGHPQVLDVGAPEAVPVAAAAPEVTSPEAATAPPAPAMETAAAEALPPEAPAAVPAPAMEAPDAVPVAEVPPAAPAEVSTEPASAPEPTAELPAAEALPFPDAQAPEAAPVFGLRETFSALVVPVAELPVGAPPSVETQPSAAPPVAEPEPPPPAVEPVTRVAAPASPVAAPPPSLAVEPPAELAAQQAETPLPPGWNRPLSALLGL